MKEQKEKNNIHKDHRIRIKKEFLDGGLENFSDHKKLELLLFYSLPQKDTNPLGHELIEKFGSLSGVFDAPYEALLDVSGVSESTATLIKLIPEMSRAYNVDKSNGKNDSMDSFEKIGEYLISKYIGTTNETVFLITLDKKGALKNCSKIAEGTVDFAQISIRKIIEEVLNANASNVIIAHCHPNGHAVPSSADIGTTRNIVRALNSVDVHLVNHFIIAQDKYFSMASDPKYMQMFI